MNDFIEKLIGRLEEKRSKYQELADSSNFDGWAQEEKIYLAKEEMCEEIISIVNQLAEEYNNGWIPCEKELPPQPKENQLFDNKPLELYLVSLNSQDYPFRAFWNGSYFTDGWGKIKPLAWQPLPEPYRKEGGSSEQ